MCQLLTERTSHTILYGSISTLAWRWTVPRSSLVQPSLFLLSTYPETLSSVPRPQGNSWTLSVSLRSPTSRDRSDRSRAPKDPSPFSVYPATLRPFDSPHFCCFVTCLFSSARFLVFPVDVCIVSFGSGIVRWVLTFFLGRLFVIPFWVYYEIDWLLIC